MPVVQMPDGTNVQMPDKPSAEQLTRLKAVQAKFAAGKGKKVTAGASEPLGDLPFMDRTILASMDNDAERKNYLTKRYGDKSVSTQGDQMVVSVGGKKMRTAPGFLASMAADAPEIAGAMYVGAQGAAAGGALGGPVGALIGGVGGAAVGAAGGKAAVEEIKRVKDLQRKTDAERTGALETAAKEGAIGEVTGRVGGKIISRLTRGPLPKFVTGATNETNKVADKVMAGGARPPMQSVAPDAKKLQRITILADKLVGPAAKTDRANAGYLQDEVTKILDKAQVPKVVKDDVISRLHTADSAISSQETGRLIQSTSKMMLAQAKGKAGKYLVQLTNAARSPEGAYGWLVHGGQTDRLDRFVQVMGKNSAVVQAVQHQALRQLFSGVMDRTMTGETSDLLSKEMARFTPKQQGLLFPGGLERDIKGLAKEIRFLYPGYKDESLASLTAGAILQRNFVRRWKAQATYAISRAILQNPAVIRRLATGFRGTNAARKASRLALREMAFFGTFELNKPGSNPGQLMEQEEQARAQRKGVIARDRTQ